MLIFNNEFIKLLNTSVISSTIYIFHFSSIFFLYLILIFTFKNFCPYRPFAYPSQSTIYFPRTFEAFLESSPEAEDAEYDEEGNTNGTTNMGKTAGSYDLAELDACEFKN